MLYFQVYIDYNKKLRKVQQERTRQIVKISGPEKIIFAVTAAFLVFAGGYFLIDRSSDAPYVVDVQTVRSSQVGEGVPAPSGSGVVNINTATAKQLQTLPGIGAVRAQNIVTDRETNGPFLVPEDLLRVSGIGEETLSEILKYITVK